MSAVLDRIRTRIVPACLTALGVALLAGGLLSYTTPVAADPLPSGTDTPSADGDSARRGVDAEPADHAAADRLRAADASGIPEIPANRVPTRVRIAALKIDLAVIRPATSYPACNVAMWYDDRTARAAGRGQGDLPVRARPDRDVPPAAQPVQDPERQEDDRDGRGAVDQRRPALPVRHHRRATARADDQRVQRPVRRQRPSSSGSRRRRASGRCPSSRSSPSPCPRSRPITPRPTRWPSRSTAARSARDRAHDRLGRLTRRVEQRRGNSPSRIVNAEAAASPPHSSAPVAERRRLARRVAHEHVDDDPQVVERGDGGVEHRDDGQDRRAGRRPRPRRGSRRPWRRSRPSAGCRSATAGTASSGRRATARAGPARRTCRGWT